MDPPRCHCRLEIKPLVRLGHPLIVATVERYKIRAHGVFFLPSGVSDLKKEKKREKWKKKSNPDGRMIGSVLMDTQWTNVSQSFQGWWRLYWVFLVTVTVAFVWCRCWKIWKNMSGSNFIIFALLYSREEDGSSCCLYILEKRQWKCLDVKSIERSNAELNRPLDKTSQCKWLWLGYVLQYLLTRVCH